MQSIAIGQEGSVAPVTLGGSQMVLIAGPCVIESREHALRMAQYLKSLADQSGVPFIFKASFDKANRTSADGFRGPGMEAGLDILAQIRNEVGVCVTTDIHAPQQAEPVASVVDLLQIPAFLCRQTDLLVAAGGTGRPVNIKKGQFQAPWDMGPAVEKVRQAGDGGVMLTERGSSFGYNNLVVDFGGLATMKALGVPVCFDATHSTQHPGGLGRSSGGDRDKAPLLARAAVGVGVDAIFLEVHDHPERAQSDASTQLHLDTVGPLLNTLVELDRVTRLHVDV